MQSQRVDDTSFSRLCQSDNDTQSLNAVLTITEATVSEVRANVLIHAHVIEHTRQQSIVRSTCLGGVCAACKIGHHVDRRRLIWKLDTCLVFVSSDIEFALYQSAKWRAKLSQLLLCGFVRQISDMEHLRPPCLFGNVSDKYVQLTEGTERPACWVHPALQVPWKEAVCIYAQHLPCWHKGADLGRQSTRAVRTRTVPKQCTDTSRGCECLMSQMIYTLGQNDA